MSQKLLTWANKSGFNNPTEAQEPTSQYNCPILSRYTRPSPRSPVITSNHTLHRQPSCSSMHMRQADAPRTLEPAPVPFWSPGGGSQMAHNSHYWRGPSNYPSHHMSGNHGIPIMSGDHVIPRPLASPIATSPERLSAKLTRKAKRQPHIHSACSNCKKAHLSCSPGRPCQRCIQSGKQDTCVSVQHKKRGRPPIPEHEKAKGKRKPKANRDSAKKARGSKSESHESGVANQSDFPFPPHSQFNYGPGAHTSLSHSGRPELRLSVSPTYPPSSFRQWDVPSYHNGPSSASSYSTSSSLRQTTSNSTAYESTGRYSSDHSPRSTTSSFSSKSSFSGSASLPSLSAATTPSHLAHHDSHSYFDAPRINDSVSSYSSSLLLPPVDGPHAQQHDFQLMSPHPPSRRGTDHDHYQNAGFYRGPLPTISQAAAAPTVRPMLPPIQDVEGRRRQYEEEDEDRRKVSCFKPSHVLHRR